MALKTEWQKRMDAVREFRRMIKDRRTFILIPLIWSIVGILIFMYAAEMPVLIPFFYAIF